MTKLLQTPSQTVGPYFAYGLTPEQYRYDFDSWATENLTEDGNITIIGRVIDGEGKPIPDAMLELWQDDGERQFFGRCGTGTDPQNRFVFRTTKPPAQDGIAPFLTLIIFMRGQLIHSFTRIYFSDEASSNALDAVLRSLPESRRDTLIARKNGQVYTFDVRMQGKDETVFFDI
jgi:protocatechuate 3,4-dioxygenase alpha subunit